MKNKNPNNNINASEDTGDDESNRQLNAKLRSYYDSIANEPIPDHFLDLLEKLDDAEKASKTSPKQKNNE